MKKLHLFLSAMFLLFAHVPLLGQIAFQYEYINAFDKTEGNYIIAINTINSHQLKYNAEEKSYVRVTQKYFAADQLVFSDSYLLVNQQQNAPGVLDVNRYAVPVNATKVEVFLEDTISKSRGSYVANIQLINFAEKDALSDMYLMDVVKEQTEFRTNYTFLDEEENLNFHVDAVLNETEDASQYLIKYSIKTISSAIDTFYLAGFAKANNSQELVLNKQLKIEALPPGTYMLYADLVNRNQEVVDQKGLIFTIISSKVQCKNDLETFLSSFDTRQLNRYVQAHYPIASPDENKQIKLLKNEENRTVLVEFLLDFYLNRDAANCMDEISSYFKLVDEANSVFRTSIMDGFQTDRGRVFLEYGRPTDQIIGKESGISDYEIWKYNWVKKQANVKFIFYNPTGIANDFVLLHSNGREEIQNPAWQQKLNENFASDGSSTEPLRDHYGSKVKQQFDSF